MPVFDAFEYYIFGKNRRFSTNRGSCCTISFIYTKCRQRTVQCYGTTYYSLTTVLVTNKSIETHTSAPAPRFTQGPLYRGDFYWSSIVEWMELSWMTDRLRIRGLYVWGFIWCTLSLVYPPFMDVPHSPLFPRWNPIDQWLRIYVQSTQLSLHSRTYHPGL